MSYLKLLTRRQNSFIFDQKINFVIQNTEATIILDKIYDHWLDNDRQPFYKFIEPCEHPKYIKGTSWFEETSIKEKAFNNAIKRLKELGLIGTENKKIEHLNYYYILEENFYTFLENIYK